MADKKNTENMQKQETQKNQTDLCQDADVDALVALLDGCTRAGKSRIKLDVVDGEGGTLSRRYHYGRCDIGSPWACGTAFDVLEFPRE